MLKKTILLLALGLYAFLSPAQSLGELEKELKQYFEGYYSNKEDLERLGMLGTSALTQPAMGVIQRFRPKDEQAIWYLYSRFYVQNPDKPIMQLVYRFSVQGEVYLIEHYELSPSAQKNYAKAWQNIKMLTKLQEADLVRQDDCSLNWLKVEGSDKPTYEIRQIAPFCPLLQGMGHLSYFRVKVSFDEQFFKSETLYFDGDRQEVEMPAVPRYRRCSKAEAKRILRQYKAVQSEAR